MERSNEKPGSTSSAASRKSTSPQRQNSSINDEQSSSGDTKPSRWRRIYEVVTWTPPNCRYNPENPPGFSMGLNVLFAFAGAFTVANLYYSHPILNILAEDFHVRDVEAAQIPTVMQAGYATGLLFLCPLGDLLPRRPFVLGLVLFTAVMWIGLCITNSLGVFTAISFICAVTTVTPQMMLPLVGDLAPVNRRATALSIVVAGFIMGILVARLLSGVLTQFVTWRAIYWFAFGMQTVIFALLWLFMPDYPRTNTGISYFKLLWTIGAMLTKHPILVQACLISFFTAATFTCFWTTLTFLLAGPPYSYSPVIIGLFALLGFVPFVFSPLFARCITDRFHSYFSVILGELMALVGILVGTYAGLHSLAGPIVQAIFNDAGLQITQVANRAAIYAVEPKGRNRINTAFMVATFCGQLMGTAAGNHIYADGGWVRSGSASVGFCCAALLMCVIRGPRETRWLGFSGSWSIKKDEVESPAPEPFGNNSTNPQADVEKGSAPLEETSAQEALEEMAAEEGNTQDSRKAAQTSAIETQPEKKETTP